ncbi:UDP-N-acetylmuramate dehydrogenase [Bythopirellula polymerisocia]|uniref:UDP-N-acetylenolpyruvoylglucosamine reductase n=1 Tax=Bythopirellula polymerisocia TaxID=2528003 RepID=A0A5C6CBP2_9BACT|nr:UDP-N-acetylmuramate dehydrogenase [Bythopirellula polymerisocia]TWU20851.1 UDP-N-acetylenolpyruvoylglucosamine reductase MurB [Bythopirellula polymerisocia]
MTLVSGFEKIVRTSEPLAHRTWLKIGGPAAFFAEPKSVDQLAALVRRCREEDVPIRILGGGSNLLVRDDGVAGMVLSLASGDFAELSIRGNQLTAGGGAKLAHAISESVRSGLAGLEPLVGIPGSIGGALHGNSGSRAGDIGQWACRATVMTRAGELFQRDREDLVFAYRQSSLDELVILSADFLLEEDDPEQLTKRMQKQWIVKKAGQPLSHQNVASIFKNPRGMSAGMLIDQAGLKGTRIGGVEVSQRHANFIVAGEGATSQDVLRLIDTIRSRVAERLGVELETELEIW